MSQTFRDLIHSVTTLNDLTVIQEAFERLINERREVILRQNLSSGKQIGMMAEKGRGDKKVYVAVNASIIEIKRGKVTAAVTAPVKFIKSGVTKVRAPFQLIRDAFDLTNMKETTFADQEEPEFEEDP